MDAATVGASPALGSVTGKTIVVITQMKRTARRKLAHTSRYVAMGPSFDLSSLIRKASIRQECSKKY